LVGTQGKFRFSTAPCSAKGGWSWIARVELLSSSQFVSPWRLASPCCPLKASASQCSTAAGRGNGITTYTGTIFTANGQLPAASVGHYNVDAAGNLVGAQTRSVAGISGAEDIVGTSTVNRDCTGTATIKVFVNGQLQRTAVLAVAYDDNMNHARGIFQSLVLSDGTNVPVVLTSDNTKVFPRD
jgi:hypothetical protein